MIFLPFEVVGGYDFGPFIAMAALGLLAIVTVIVAVVLLLMGRRRAGLVLLGCVALVALGLGLRAGLAAIADARFRAADPGYAAAERPFDGRSLYVPNPCAVSRAAYGRVTDLTRTLPCGLPVERWLREGLLDFVELGESPDVTMTRYTLRDGDPDCLRGPAADQDLILPLHSAPYGVCVLGERISAPEATHEIAHDARRGGWDEAVVLSHVALQRRDDGTVLSQFDGWSEADPYGTDTPPSEARRPDGALAALLRLPPAWPEGTARAITDRLLSARGLPDAALLRAIAAPDTGRSQRAQILFFACRDDVAPRLDTETVAAINAGAQGLFSERPTYRFPQDCHPNLRRPVLPQEGVPTFAPGVLEQ